MEKQIFELDEREITLYSDPEPEWVLLQPIDEQDTRLLDRQAELMGGGACRFALAAFAVHDWNRDLSPWEAPPVFGSIPFEGRAKDTLRFMENRLLPALRGRMGLSGREKICVGGYSLAGLFALWASAGKAGFDGVAAASPSVWFPGWMDYVRANPVQAEIVYLSLGDREEKAKNPVMAAVGSCIREMQALLLPDRTAILEWNSGGHFQNSEQRTARAFRWVMEQSAQQKDQKENTV